jgi:hypothetical protein
MKNCVSRKHNTINLTLTIKMESCFETDEKGWIILAKGADQTFSVKNKKVRS